MYILYIRLCSAQSRLYTGAGGDASSFTADLHITSSYIVSFRVERETAARISEEIGNLMKEIETLVEEKTKETFDITKTVREGKMPQMSQKGAEGNGERLIECSRK